MTTTIVPNRAVFEEANSVLLEHLSPSKVARFWAEVSAGSGDYVALKRKLFAGETVDSLVVAVRDFENESAA